VHVHCLRLVIVVFALVHFSVNLQYALQESVLVDYSSGRKTLGLWEHPRHRPGFGPVERLSNTTALPSPPADLEGQAQRGFSACLIVKDDNHWLIEWLAYHYHVLPLRHLILLKDPSSVTSPTRILERWRGKMLVEEWTDADFLPPWVLRKAATANTNGLWLHLNRQKFFYAKCLRNLHSRNRTFALLTDTDEFVRINPYRHHLSAHERKQPGHIGRFLQQLPDRVLDRISCFVVPRIQVSTLEKPRPVTSTMMQWLGYNHREPEVKNWNASDFLTLRFLYHNQQHMKSGKNIINLRNLRAEQLPQRTVPSVHRVMSQCPNTTGNALLAEDSHLQIQHYLGTFAQFTYRDDPRNAIQQDRWESWYTRGRHPEPTKRDDGMAPWLDGFVATHGRSEASSLLYGVGKLEAKRSSGPRIHDGNSTVPKQSGTFSACLVVKDDNHWLIEWLAYHYHVLPLRRLIVMVDPSSRTTPHHIFQRWEGLIDIETWSQESIVPAHIFRKVRAGNISASGLHRQRQQFFYGHCLRHLHQHNATWVLVADTDEFVVPAPVSNETSSLREPGVVSKLLQMKTQSQRKNNIATSSPSCLLLPRIQMTNRLPNDADIISQNVPEGFSGSDFLTTKWLFHNGHEIRTGHNLDGKNILNLQNLQVEDIPKKVKNVHYLLPESCPRSDGNRLSHPDTWLWMYHYLGTLEQYTFREDPRDDIVGRPKRNETLWNAAGQKEGHVTMRDDAIRIRQWLVGFVDAVGCPNAQRLLEGVGETHTVTF
jgi:hypothetical protein